MKVEFDVKISGKDMYRFNMHHAYTGSQGIISILIAVLCFVMAVIANDKMDITYVLLYAGFGVLFLVYIPIGLYLRSKRQIMNSEVLKHTLHYVIDDAGIHTSQQEETADLPWEAVYKVISTGHNVLIYSSRANAFIIPKDQIGQEFAAIQEIAAAHLPKYRLKMK